MKTEFLIVCKPNLQKDTLTIILKDSFLLLMKTTLLLTAIIQ